MSARNIKACPNPGHLCPSLDCDFSVHFKILIFIDYWPTSSALAKLHMWGLMNTSASILAHCLDPLSLILPPLTIPTALAGRKGCIIGTLSKLPSSEGEILEENLWPEKKIIFSHRFPPFLFPAAACMAFQPVIDSDNWRRSFPPDFWTHKAGGALGPRMFLLHISHTHGNYSVLQSHVSRMERACRGTCHLDWLGRHSPQVL